MSTAREFLMEFLKEIINNPAKRPELLEKYIRLMEERDAFVR